MTWNRFLIIWSYWFHTLFNCYLEVILSIICIINTSIFSCESIVYQFISSFLKSNNTVFSRVIDHFIELTRSLINISKNFFSSSCDIYICNCSVLSCFFIYISNSCQSVCNCTICISWSFCQDITWNCLS